MAKSVHTRAVLCLPRFLISSGCVVPARGICGDPSTSEPRGHGPRDGPLFGEFWLSAPEWAWRWRISGRQRNSIQSDNARCDPLFQALRPGMVCVHESLRRQRELK